jgi:hypothetical protein
MRSVKQTALLLLFITLAMGSTQEEGCIECPTETGPSESLSMEDLTVSPDGQALEGYVDSPVAITCFVGGGTPPYVAVFTFGDQSDADVQPILPLFPYAAVTHVYQEAGFYWGSVYITDSSTPMQRVEATFSVTVTEF